MNYKEVWRTLLGFRHQKKSVDLTEENFPDTAMLEAELEHVSFRFRYRRILLGACYALLVVAAVSVLVATLLLPVMKIYGNSMTPTLNEQDIVLSVKSGDFEQGDVIAFYFNNHILVKRIVATEGQRVYIDKGGSVFVDGELLDEPYVTEKSLGQSDIEYPYTVPENTYFVLGDHRATSVDSRTTTIGCVDTEEVVGKIIFTIWPPKDFGGIS